MMEARLVDEVPHRRLTFIDFRHRIRIGDELGICLTCRLVTPGTQIAPTWPFLCLTALSESKRSRATCTSNARRCSVLSKPGTSLLSGGVSGLFFGKLKLMRGRRRVSWAWKGDASQITIKTLRGKPGSLYRTRQLFQICFDHDSLIRLCLQRPKLPF